MAFSSQPNSPQGQPSGALAATQQLLRATLDATLDMIQVFEAVRNPQGQIIDFIWLLNNHTSERIYGDVVGKSLLELQPGVVEEGIFEAFKQVVESGESQQYEKRYRHEQFDGWFNQSVVKLDDGVVTTTADITSRKRAEAQLLRSQALLQSVIDSSLDSIQVFKAVRDEAGSIIDFVWVMNNQKAVARNGAVVGKSLLEVNPGVLPTGIFDHMVEVAQTGVAYEQEQYYAHEQFEGWFYQALVKTDGGVTMTTRDITQAKQAEGQILRLKEEIAQQATDKYYTIFNSIDEGFLIHEMIRDQAGRAIDLRLMEANPAFTRQTGLGADTVGKRASEFMPNLERFWIDTYDRVARSGIPEQVENYNQATYRWYSVHVSPIGGQDRQVAVLFEDITERKQRESSRELLLGIAQDLGRLTDEAKIVSAIGAKLAAHLGLSCYHYVDIDEEHDQVSVRHFWHALEVPHILGTYPLGAFVSLEALAAWRAGKPTIIHDIKREVPDGTPEAAVLKAGATAQKISAFMAVGLSQGGTWKAYFAVADSRPRQWTDSEIELVQEVANQLFPRIERARAEEALRESQKRFESIVNLVPDLLWESQPDGSTNWYNQRWLAYTGQRFEEAIGWGWTQAIHPDDREASAKRYGQAVEAGQPLRQEHRIRRHDGAYRWFTVSASPLKDEHGQVTRMYGAATDIHESKQAEEVMRALEKRTRLALEAADMATWEWDIVQDQVYWNEQHFHLMGMAVSPNPLPTQAFLSHLHPDDTQSVQDQLRQTITQRMLYDAEFRIIREDGVVRWMCGYGQVTAEQDGQPVLVSGVMFDINDRKEAEEALRLADRRKDEFLAMLAHELRNPMSTIRSGVNILALTTTDPMIHSTVDMMERQTDHLVRMVDDLLDVSRISRGKIELKLERANLVELVRQAQQSIEASFEQQGKVLRVSLPTAPVEVEGDATRLTQVVINLLTNGLRYTGEQGQVWLNLTHQGKEAILQVRDNGIGLHKDQLSAIFELFVQVDNSLARAKGGLGLGLTLVKRLVELHGGRVAAQSGGIGQGSTFTVHLPTLTAIAQPVATPAPQVMGSATAQRLLVIDDNTDAALMLAMLLKLKGYETHTRASGRAGIEAAESLQPSAILLDIGMPDLDGYATCRLLREQAWGQAIVVIALTGYGQEEDRQRTREAGFDGHLVKPVDMGELTKLLTDLLGKDRNRAGLV